MDRLRKLRDQRRSKRGKRGKPLLLLGLLTVMLVTLLLFSGVLFTGVVSAQESPRTFRIPFREVNQRILIEVEVDGGAPATLLFDTGARVSVWFSPTGHDCGLRLAHHARGKFALACDGSSPGVAFIAPESGVRFNGFIGADLMSKFSAVRIDFKAHTLELEQ